MGQKKSKIQSIGFNLDYSPYAKKRDKKIKKWAETENILVFSEEDMLLHGLLNGDTKSKNSGDPYKVFTPFMKHLRANYKVKNPTKKSIKVKKMSINSKYEITVKEINKFYKKNKDIN